MNNSKPRSTHCNDLFTEDYHEIEYGKIRVIVDCEEPAPRLSVWRGTDELIYLDLDAIAGEAK